MSHSQKAAIDCLDVLLIGSAPGICDAIQAKLQRDGHCVVVDANAPQSQFEVPAREFDAIVIEAASQPQGTSFLELTDEAVGSSLTAFIDLVVLLQRGIASIRKGGSVVVIASRNYLGVWGSAHEAAFSAAIVALMRCVTLELTASGIRSNVIARDLTASVDGGQMQEAGAIAAIVAFLVGHESQLINGEVLLADRGRCLQIREARKRVACPTRVEPGKTLNTNDRDIR